MILILSIADDMTTQDVCQWLRFQKKDFIVLNKSDKIVIEEHSNSQTIIRITNRNQTINLDAISSFWYRRSDLGIISEFDYLNKEVAQFIKANSNSDLEVSTELLHHLFSEKSNFTTIDQSKVNKLIVLNEANKVGLRIPPYLLTGSKEQLKAFQKLHGELIYKSPSPSVYPPNKDFVVKSLTQKLEEKQLAEMPEKFGISFFQKKIEKKFEIRTLYINDTFRSIAIISQKNSETEVDYRNYDDKKPNRKIPYKLDEETEQKLRMLIKQLKLKFCSIDIIVGRDNNYYFLEINPIGQFGILSYYRNDFIEREIANTLN